MTSRSKPSAAPHASGNWPKSVEEILVDRGRRPVDFLLLGHVGLEPAPLLAGVAQFMESIGELNATTVQLETLGCARIVRVRLRKRRLARRIIV